jgi:hypothetical protein
MPVPAPGQMQSSPPFVDNIAAAGSTQSNATPLPMTPEPAALAPVDDAIAREQVNFDRGVIEAIAILVDLLAVNGAIDREHFHYLLQGHIAVLLESTAEHPNGLNPQRALPLQMLELMLKIFSPAAPYPGKAN